MKIHRFYIHEMHNKFGPISLGSDLWIHDEKLLNQWLRVLRFKVGDELVLFNDTEERLYKISEIEYPHSVHLILVTEMERTLPSKKIILLWSVLKKDKNDWVLQKCTELGVHTFVPVLASRGEKTNISVERAQKIVIEAAEQCGRSDIPLIREPVLLHEALQEYKDTPLYIFDQSGDVDIVTDHEEVALLVGPEGGWSDTEKEDFKAAGLLHMAISPFTLRAETAAVVAVSKIM